MAALICALFAFGAAPALAYGAQSDAIYTLEFVQSTSSDDLSAEPTGKTGTAENVAISEENMMPGDTLSATFHLRANYDGAATVGVWFASMDADSELEQAMRVRLTRLGADGSTDTSTVLFDGTATAFAQRMAAKHSVPVDAAAAAQAAADTSSQAAYQCDEWYKFELYLPTSVGNEAADKDFKATIRWRITRSGSAGGGGGGGAAEGDNGQDEPGGTDQPDANTPSNDKQISPDPNAPVADDDGSGLVEGAFNPGDEPGDDGTGAGTGTDQPTNEGAGNGQDGTNNSDEGTPGGVIGRVAHFLSQTGDSAAARVAFLVMIAVAALLAAYMLHSRRKAGAGAQAAAAGADAQVTHSAPENASSAKAHTKLRRSIIAVLLLILAWVLVTYAVATSEVDSDVNHAHTGKVDITLVDKAGNANEKATLFDGSDTHFEPGATEVRQLWVRNDGTAAAWFKLYFTDVVGNLATVCDVTVTDLGPVDKAGEGVTGDTTAEAKVLFSGKASELTLDSQSVTAGLLDGSQTRLIEIKLHYPESAGNAGQGQSLSFAIGATAVQAKNNENADFGTGE
jgi:hypothetical protein